MSFVYYGCQGYSQEKLVPGLVVDTSPWRLASELKETLEKGPFLSVCMCVMYVHDVRVCDHILFHCEAVTEITRVAFGTLECNRKTKDKEATGQGASWHCACL